MGIPLAITQSFEALSGLFAAGNRFAFGQALRDNPLTAGRVSGLGTAGGREPQGGFTLPGGSQLSRAVQGASGIKFDPLSFNLDTARQVSGSIDDLSLQGQFNEFINRELGGVATDPSLGEVVQGSLASRGRVRDEALRGLDIFSQGLDRFTGAARGAISRGVGGTILENQRALSEGIGALITAKIAATLPLGLATIMRQEALAKFENQSVQEGELLKGGLIASHKSERERISQGVLDNGQVKRRDEVQNDLRLMESRQRIETSDMLGSMKVKWEVMRQNIDLSTQQTVSAAAGTTAGSLVNIGAIESQMRDSFANRTAMAQLEGTRMELLTHGMELEGRQVEMNAIAALSSLVGDADLWELAFGGQQLFEQLDEARRATEFGVDLSGILGIGQVAANLSTQTIGQQQADAAADAAKPDRFGQLLSFGGALGAARLGRAPAP